MLRPTLPNQVILGQSQMLVNCSSDPLKKIGDYWGILHICTNHAVGVNQIPDYWGTVFSPPLPPPPQYNPHQLPNRGGSGANIAGAL